MLKSLRKQVGNVLRARASQRLQQSIAAEFQRAFSHLGENGSIQDLRLPENYGRGLPERTVELLLARLTYQAGAKVLDVGHANAMSCHLDMLRTLPVPRHLTGIDIAQPTYDTRPWYEQSIQADIAGGDSGASPAGPTFDLIWCISTLEHIGLDNAGYTAQFERNDDLDRQAFERMLGYLAPAGRLLVTVPYGKAENHGWLRNYDQQRWQDMVDKARRVGEAQTWYFRHTFGAGWQLADAEELQYVGYYDQQNAGAGAIAAVLAQRCG